MPMMRMGSPDILNWHRTSIKDAESGMVDLVQPCAYFGPAVPFPLSSERTFGLSYNTRPLASCEGSYHDRSAEQIAEYLYYLLAESILIFACYLAASL